MTRRTGHNPAKSCEVLLDAAMIAFEARDFARARKLIDALLVLDQRTPMVLWLYTICAAEMGDVQAAQVTFAEAESRAREQPMQSSEAREALEGLRAIAAHWMLTVPAPRVEQGSVGWNVVT